MNIRNTVKPFFFILLLLVIILTGVVGAQEKAGTLNAGTFEGVSRVKIFNYEDCVELKNATARVVLGHHVGGRLLVYERNGNNVLYLNPKEKDWDPENTSQKKQASAGRFDVGPEWLQVRGSAIWSGEWKVEVLGDRKARMTSQVDPDSGLLVHRDFELDKETSRLTVIQTVENHSEKVVKQCYWSRTFAKHGGVVVIPCDPTSSRMPNLHVMYHKRYLLDFQPNDPAIRRVDDFLVIDGPTKFPKTGFDSNRSWVGYQTRDDLLFVKKYRVFSEKQYGEVSGMNLSIWYPTKEKLAACEIEPIGPLETLKPGEKATFQTEWWLLDRKFPSSGIVDPVKVGSLIKRKCSIFKK